MDALLAEFNEKRDILDGSSSVLIPRIEKSPKNIVDNPFYLPYNNRVYDKQFFKLYQYRLNVMRDRIYKAAMRKWADYKHMKKVLDIEYGSKCWCIGSIYCEMKYKPNILEDVSNDVYGAPDLITQYSDSVNDEIMFEDESGRVILRNLCKKFVTGTVVGLLGEEDDDGNFQVEDICFPEELPLNDLISVDSSLSSSSQIAFISGLNIDSYNLNSLEVLQNYLIGGLTNHNISKLIILGNLIKNVSFLPIFNDFLVNISKSVIVEILPGLNDPSDKSLPQQPLNKKLIDNSDSKTVQLSTNPSILYMGETNLEILMSSGENLNDIFKYNFITTTRPQMMELTLRCQNIAPTAPDTLSCYPYDDKDPFILSKWPNVYVVGNQPDFFQFDMEIGKDQEITNGKKIHCIGVPEFCTNKEGSSPNVHKLVLFNPYTLFTETVCLS